MAAGVTTRVAPSGGRRAVRKQRTRNELLAAGRRLFAEKGLYDSRIEDLTRHAGIAKGTLYLYFANKEQLIEAVVTDGFRALLERVHAAAHDPRSRAELLAGVVTGHLEFFDENPDLMRIFHQVRGLLKYRGSQMRGLRRAFANYLSALAKVIALRPAARTRRGVADRDVAMLLFGAVSGAVSVRASLGAESTPPAVASATVRAVVQMAQAFEAPESRASERVPFTASAARARRRVRARR